jgi:hypothetical protein
MVAAAALSFAGTGETWIPELLSLIELLKIPSSHFLQGDMPRQNAAPRCFSPEASKPECHSAAIIGPFAPRTRFNHI